HSNIEPFGVADFAGAIFAGIESESLFVNVTEQMKRLYSNVGSTKAALKQRPEVFDAVSVNIALYVALKMIHDQMGVVFLKSQIVAKFVGHNPSSRHDAIFDNLVHHLFL